MNCARQKINFIEREKMFVQKIIWKNPKVIFLCLVHNKLPAKSFHSNSIVSLWPRQTQPKSENFCISLFCVISARLRLGGGLCEMKLPQFLMRFFIWKDENNIFGGNEGGRGELWKAPRKTKISVQLTESFTNRLKIKTNSWFCYFCVFCNFNLNLNYLGT